MRLIDADGFLDLLNTENQRYVIRTGHELTLSTVRSFIKHQPTVYDVDKVVERLETDEKHTFDGCINKRYAIEIIKNGLNTGTEG